MLDFQKIRNKQKWLFGLIAVPVIFGFVILFTPDAEDRLFGRNSNGSQGGAFGAIDGKPVTRDEWITARNLAGLLFSRNGDRFVENKIPDILVEMKLLSDYSINISQADVMDQLNSQIANGSRTRKAILDSSKNFGSPEKPRLAEKNFIRAQQYVLEITQLSRLAGIGSGLISKKEAEIKYREENEQYNVEAVILSHTNYLPLVQIDDAKLQEYYTNSISKYRLSESRQLSYVTFPPTNYLEQAEAKYNELPEEERKSLLQSCWPSDTNITTQATATISELAKHVVSVQTNEFGGMEIEQATAQIREQLLTTGVGMKAGLAVIEAYNAGEDFQNSLRTTYDAKPELDTLEKVALLQNIEVKTTPPMRRDLPFVPGLQRVSPTEVFALSATNALISGASSLSSAANADPYFVASLKKITPARDRSFAEAKPLVTEDYKKAESIKLLTEAGDKLQQALKDEKPLADIAKENNLKVVKLGPFGSSSGNIEGLDTPALAEDIRTQALGLDAGATSELITSSTDSDVTDHEVAFVIKLNSKEAVSQETFDKEFDAYLEQSRQSAAMSAYTGWLKEQKDKLYKYSFNAYADEGGSVSISGKPSDGTAQYFKSLEVVEIVATPNDGFEFKEWEGLVREGKTNQKNTVLVIDNSSVTATFAPKAAGEK